LKTNGYTQRQLEIDDAMAALGRPPAPVVSWISGGLKGDFAARSGAWKKQLEAWEQENPEKAIRWYELRDEAIDEDERLEAEKWANVKEAYTYERLLRMGAPSECVNAIRKPQDTRAIKKAREWFLEGSWCLTLIGGVGVGKTTAATFAAHELILRGHNPRWVRCAEVAGKPLFGVEAEVLKFNARTAGVLVLDDIGAGAHEKDSKVWLQWLDDVLDARWGNKRKTIITSNSMKGGLAEWLGLRLADRINSGILFNCGEGSMRSKRLEAAND
jgi:DNA replication protein DnaC